MVATCAYLVQGKQHFGVIVLYRLERYQLAFEGVAIKDRSRYLEIGEPILRSCHKVDLLVRQLADGNLVSASDEFKIYDVLDLMSDIRF